MGLSDDLDGFLQRTRDPSAPASASPGVDLDSYLASSRAGIPQPSSTPVNPQTHPLLADLPLPHEAAANATQSAQDFLNRLESVGQQMEQSAIPPALRPSQPAIEAAPHPFLNRLREAVSGPDTALGSIDGNKTTKPLVNLGELVPDGTVPMPVHPYGGAPIVQVPTAAAKGVAEGVSGLTAPINLAAIPLTSVFGEVGGPVVSRLAAAGFSLQGIKSLYDTVPQFRKAVASGDSDNAMRLAGQMGVSAVVTVLAGRDALKAHPTSPAAEAFPETSTEPTAPTASTTPANLEEFLASDGAPQSGAASKSQPQTPDRPLEASTAPPAQGLDLDSYLRQTRDEAASRAQHAKEPQQPVATRNGPPTQLETLESSTPVVSAEALQPGIAEQAMPAPSGAASGAIMQPEAVHRLVTDLSDESLGAPSGDGASDRLQQLPDDDLFRVKQAAEDRSNTAAGQAVDDELARRYPDDSTMNPRRVVFVGDGYQLRGSEDLGTFSTERDAFNAMKAEAAGQPFKGPVIDLPQSAQEGSSSESQSASSQSSEGQTGPVTPLATDQRGDAEAAEPGRFAAGDQTHPITSPAAAPRGNSPTSVQLNSILGGLEEPLKRFGEQDVLPKLKDAATAVSDAADDIQKVFAPTTRGVAGKRAANVLRGNISESVRDYQQAQDALSTARRFFDSQDPAANYAFIDRVERGAPQNTPEEQQIADTFRQLLDSRRQEVQALGTGKLQDFYENYFPHIWQDPAKATDVFKSMLGRRPLEGSKRFLKQRTHVTFDDGLQAGLKPVSDNPVDLALLKAREMDRYVMAHRTLGQLEDSGLAQKLPISQRAPEGWVRIADPIGTVYGPPANGGMTIRANWYAPEEAARVINNYLSPGLRQKGWYRTLLGANNVLNQAQLGLSAFHLGFTSADAAISRAALGFEQLLRGRPLTGLKSLLSTPLAPLTTAFKGNQLLKEWYRPGSEGGEIAAITNELANAGGRARMDSFYSSDLAANMVQAWRNGNVIGAAWRMPFAALEKLSKPLMEELVPRQKLGIFLDHARFEMEQHSQRVQALEGNQALSPQDLAAGTSVSLEDMRQGMRDAWDSIDNRMGQMTYDNLFWNRTAKDLAMLSVRSVGWNLGTLREIGGGLGDLVKQPINAARGEHVNAKRISYLMALSTVVPLMNAVYQYGMTGNGPQELLDYIAPRNGQLDENGRPQRVWLPTYARDIFGWATAPMRTLADKSSPLINLTAEMVRNKDFYGNKIRNEDDPLVQQLLSEAKFVGKEAMPFGLHNYLEQQRQGQSGFAKAENFIGITPAPRSIEQTKAEQLAGDLVERNMPAGGRTQEQADRSALQRQLMRDVNQGKDVRATALQALKEGQLTPKQLVETLKDSKLSPIERMVKHLGASDVLKVYSAGNAQEQQTLRPVLIHKLISSSKTLSEEQFVPLAARVKAALQATGSR